MGFRLTTLSASVALLVVHNVAPAQTQLWAAQNRYIELSVGSYQKNYAESDAQALTSNGVLDTEIGNLNALSASLRWQFDVGWLVQLQAQRQSGKTLYSGYLQSGTSLISYLAYTGNVATQYDLNAGYAINHSNWHWMPEGLQITPLLALRQNNWQRNLVQYDENYGHTSVAGGALLQWHARTGTIFEAQVLHGKAHVANVNVPSFDFSGTQPGNVLDEWQLAATQDLGELTGVPALQFWRISTRYINTRYSHDASAIQNNLQAPPSQNSSSLWLLGLQRWF